MKQNNIINFNLSLLSQAKTTNQNRDHYILDSIDQLSWVTLTNNYCGSHKRGRGIGRERRENGNDIEEEGMEGMEGEMRTEEEDDEMM